MSPLRPFATALLVLLVVTPAARAAEVFRVSAATRAALPRGKEADGKIGDWVIRNDQVVAVIGETADWRDANQMVEGVQGAVIDFTSRADNNDELVVFYPMGYRPTGVSANRAEIVRSNGTSAELKVIRDATPDEPYTSTTIYTLNDGEPYLRVRTVHENTSVQPVKVTAHDWLRLDNDITCTQAHGDQPVVFMENKWYRAAYGVAALDGRTQRASKDLSQQNLRSIGALVHYPAVNPRQDNPLTLAAGQKIELNRILVVARDAAGVQTVALRALGQQAPAVELHVTETGGGPVADAFVEVKKETIVSGAITGPDGSCALPLADGTYTVSISQIGRPALTRELVVRDGRAASPTLALEPRSEVTLDLREAKTGLRLPVKVEFRGRAGTPAPFLGPQKRPNGAGNTFYSARGQDSFGIPAGSYEVHISHGPEYEAVVRELTVPAGGRVTLAAELRRAFDTPGWLIADLHSHSTGSGDSAVELAGRVLNQACAGVEFAPATEHNRISTYTPTIRELGLEHFIASATGIELSGRPGPGATNHQIAFPLELHEELQGGGAPRTDANPYVQMKRLYDLDHRSPKLMQQNHPNIGWLYFDRDRDGVPDGGYGTRPLTDVMEIRETMLRILDDTDPAAKARTSRAFHWLQMLNQGDRIYGTANTDSHAVGPQNGAMFNYVRVDHADLATLDPWDVARAVKAGHVVMSNGPFLDVSINGVLPGDSTAAVHGAVAVKIKVLQAGWARIDRVQVLVNGRQVPEANFTRARQPEAFGDGVVQFEREVPLQLAGDAHIIVVATGEHATIGMVCGGQFAKNHPIAISNPIFVDVDGGGFAANHDTLGAPLPDGKPGAGERELGE